MSRRKQQNSLSGVYPVDTGEVEIREDAYSAGYEVFINGVPSSHIAEDPLDLQYEYMRWIACGVEDFLTLDAPRLTHLGGGFCTLARYFAHSFPRSKNTVVELDSSMCALARELVDLPRAPRLKIRAGEARSVVETFYPHSRDVIIRDVFAGSTTPNNVATVEFYQLCQHSLSPGGLFVANCGDHSTLQLAKAELSGLLEVFAHVAVIADPPMLKGRRYGNMILFASDAPLLASPQLHKKLLGGGVPAQWKDTAWVRRFCSSVASLHDSDN